jgi:NAD(P)-dependent dehydrogenase (short-subunit alcohol dehydrogenase family)
VKVLTGKAIVITGAGQGLGRAYSLDAASHGAAVVVNDIDVAVADAVVAEIRAGGGTAEASHDSVTTWAGAHAIIDRCLSAFGRIDGLVNNAGVLQPGPIEKMDETQIRTTIEVNLTGALFVGRCALEHMIRQGSGSVVNNVSSSQMGHSQLSVYGATKGALATVTYSWAVELASTGVRVNAFSPSARTRMSGLSPDPASLKSPSPEGNAPVVTYLLSDAAEGVTGQVIQRRGNAFAVVAHPRVLPYTAAADAWSLETVIERFDPVLRAHLQQTGWPPPEGR